MAIQESTRRKKKKKQAGSGPLIILLSAGGALVLGGIVVAVILLTRTPKDEPDPNKQAAQNPGDKRAKEVDKTKQPEDKEQPKDVGTKKRPDSYRLRINRVERRNELRNIGQLYTAYTADFGRPPGKVEEFLKYIERDARELHKAIADKYYVVLPNVKSGMVAYEYDPDNTGRHGIADVSGVVEEIDSIVGALAAGLVGGVQPFVTSAGPAPVDVGEGRVGQAAGGDIDQDGPVADRRAGHGRRVQPEVVAVGRDGIGVIENPFE